MRHDNQGYFEAEVWAPPDSSKSVRADWKTKQSGVFDAVEVAEHSWLVFEPALSEVHDTRREGLHSTPPVPRSKLTLNLTRDTQSLWLR